MALSDVYEESETGFGFLVRAEDVDKYTSIESLKDAVVITQSGSVQEGLYNQYVTESKEFKLVANMTDGYLAVAENKADVCICNVDGGDLYAQANGGLATTSFRFTVDPNMNGTVVALPNDGNSDSLMEVVNEAIAELKEQGLVAQWVDEYTAYAATLGIN
jgi:polar amino acid transport system substrate-binding protein